VINNNFAENESLLNAHLTTNLRNKKPFIHQNPVERRSISMPCRNTNQHSPNSMERLKNHAPRSQLLYIIFITTTIVEIHALSFFVHDNNNKFQVKQARQQDTVGKIESWSSRQA